MRSGTTPTSIPVFVDHVKIKKSFQLAPLANFVDGALRCGAGEQRHKIGGHDAADSALGITDQLTHFSAPLRIEQRDNVLAPLLGEAVDKGNGVVGSGARDQTAELIVVDQRENIRQQLRRQLFEHFGGPPRGQ